MLLFVNGIKDTNNVYAKQVNAQLLEEDWVRNVRRYCERCPKKP